jgi:hypothetical protein
MAGSVVEERTTKWEMFVKLKLAAAIFGLFAMPAVAFGQQGTEVILLRKKRLTKAC